MDEDERSTEDDKEPCDRCEMPMDLCECDCLGCGEATDECTCDPECSQCCAPLIVPEGQTAYYGAKCVDCADVVSGETQ